MTLNVQFLTMAAMMGCGAALGLFYDAYRVVSGEFRFPRWLTPPLDLIYWLIGTLAVFRVLYVSNGGEVRIYVFLALMIGVCFYFGLLSGAFVRVIRWTIRLVKRLVALLLRILDLLLVRPVLGLYRFIVWILGFLGVSSIFLFKFVIQLFYPLWRFVVWLVRPLGERLYAWTRANQWLTPALRRLSQAVASWFKRK